ncbi:hypothetical protein COV17_01490 [Candidatus Woesearchaeota archaeon CG10_big_fil_rev_8_21_14_0_10_36_11]|nr:MAG: hypothetical protein COV17_01490 [Candidatus Woesearchaeota archaeon CG10_big_fil_rev_8_21_14_0_10_36_11]
MDYTHIILRYGELFLKGKNQTFFEKKLVDNVKKMCAIKDIKKLRGRSIFPYFEDHTQLKRIFGIVSYSLTIRVNKDVTKIQEIAAQLVTKGTFRVETKRSDKTFKTQSPKLNIDVGKYIEAHTNATFNLTKPTNVLHIEINQDGAFIFTEIVSCFGGLPVGTGGTVVTLIDNKASVLATIFMMKRGLSIFPVALKKQDINLLQQFSPIPLTLKIIKNQEEIDSFAHQKKIGVMVVGETFDDFKKHKTDLLILRPLVTYPKKDIQQLLTHFSNF